MAQDRPTYEHRIDEAEGLGVRVQINRGYDGKPVIMVDTDEELETPMDRKHGPDIRIRLNDYLLHGGYEEAQ